jgi:hypothetical protein
VGQPQAALIRPFLTTREVHHKHEGREFRFVTGAIGTDTPVLNSENAARFKFCRWSSRGSGVVRRITLRDVVHG